MKTHRTPCCELLRALVWTQPYCSTWPMAVMASSWSLTLMPAVSWAAWRPFRWGISPLFVSDLPLFPVTFSSYRLLKLPLARHKWLKFYSHSPASLVGTFCLQQRVVGGGTKYLTFGYTPPGCFCLSGLLLGLEHLHAIWDMWSGKRGSQPLLTRFGFLFVGFFSSVFFFSVPLWRGLYLI